jgi:hypothetical protein
MPQQSYQTCLNEMTDPRSHINGSALTFNGSTHLCSPIIHNLKTGGAYTATPVQSCKGAQMLLGIPGGGASPVTGILMVHLVDDAPGVLFPLELIPGNGPIGAQFDKIGDATLGTTVHIDNSLLVFPDVYSQEPQP